MTKQWTAAEKKKFWRYRLFFWIGMALFWFGAILEGILFGAGGAQAHTGEVFFSEFLLRLFEKNQPAAKLLPDNYVDREIECFTDYREFKVRHELNRHTFLAALDEKEGIEEKYAYAYSVYTRLIRGHKYGVKSSDTPRVITAKLSAMRKNELESATPVYEDIRYRVVSPSPDICDAELKKLVQLVKEIL